MEIKKIRLSDVGPFTDLVVAFAPTETHASKVTVFVGNNGCGKTTILKSLATSLSWLVARIRSQHSKGVLIDQDNINTAANSASITIDVHEPDYFNLPHEQDFSWTVVRSRPGHSALDKGTLVGAAELARCYGEMLSLVEVDASLPLIVYYPVERSVLDIPLELTSRTDFNQLEGYENALGQGVDFKRFFEWFRQREDIENESGVSSVLLSDIKKAIANPDKKVIREIERMVASSRDKQLNAVRTAISTFMPGFDNLRVQRKPRLLMAIDKGGQTLNVAQLSQGEKSMMALVGDIARRLAMMNPGLDNPLMGNGVVLIDEVDMHLHPQWQRRLIHQLTETFPQCQFILTTHSPLVISDTKNVLCYVLDEGQLKEQNGLYGLDANQVLMSVMNTEVRNSDVQGRLDRLLDLLHGNKLNEAKALFEELSSELPSGHIELAKAALLIRKMELRSA